MNRPSVSPKPNPSALPKGTRLQNGAYAVSEILGQGGFGITYRGGDLSLHRYVAIKELFPAGSSRDAQNGGLGVVPGANLGAAMFAKIKHGFLDEARTLARFNHPGIVRVYSVFEQNNTAYMVMEMLKGPSLAEKLRDNGPLSEGEALAIAVEIGGALEVVHGAGLLHRDIKPNNIILREADAQNPVSHAVLIDFGTAREFSSDQTHVMTAQVTVGYAPLEQYSQQARFGPFTDVYALAATLYHCLTGRVPVSALDRMNGVELSPLRTLNPQVSQAVARAIEGALSIKSDARPQSVREFLHLIAPDFAVGAPTIAVPLGAFGRPAAQVPVQAPILPPIAPRPIQKPAAPEAPQSLYRLSPTTKSRLGWALFTTTLGFVATIAAGHLNGSQTATTAARMEDFAPGKAPRETEEKPSRMPDDREIYTRSANIMKKASSYPDQTVVDDFNAKTSRAGYSGGNVFWAEGQFVYSGPAGDFSYPGGSVPLQGKDGPNGSSRVSWAMRVTFDAEKNQIGLLSLALRPVE